MEEGCLGAVISFRQRLRESSRTTQKTLCGGYFGGRWVLRPVSVVIEKDLNSYQSEASGTSQSLWEGKALHKGRFLKIHMNILSLTGMGENSVVQPFWEMRNIWGWVHCRCLLEYMGNRLNTRM